ncbi:MAG: cardiolipin synthase [Acutalibacteraceae bacterium]|nr:cardiolipin synthase [Acutalibacteraceae bacterium]
MRTESKTAVKNSIGRMIFVVLSVLLQIGWLFVLAQWLDDYSAVISVLASVVAVMLVCIIYSKDINSAMKTPWIIVILLFPIMGICLYFLVGHSNVTRGMRKRFEKIDATLIERLVQDKDVLNNLEDKDIGIANQMKYVVNYGKYPVYQNTDVEFYDDALKGIEAQKEELKKAKKFIFMEYHAIEDAESFDSIKKILAEKVKQGVEVRIFYDDIGSIGFINHDFIKRMESLGIKCRVFNPLIPFLNIFMNNRDHRKITVIDGKIGFTGGYNLANEYFNITHPYGNWKDTGVKMTGDAVKSLTVMFLEMWNAIKKTDQSYDSFFPDVGYQTEQCAYIQPYADSPLDSERVGESVYMNIIKNAKRYVYFMTPYLIISDEMSRELELASKRGIDVRIITPGIPDKKLIFEVTRSYYARLAKSGVRIYEYTPGFCHAKQCVCDDEIATVGTINLDYRSLYLHFENGVLLYDCPAVEDIKKDFDNTFSECNEVTEKYKSGRSAVLRFGQCVLRLISPLL